MDIEVLAIQLNFLCNFIPTVGWEEDPCRSMCQWSLSLQFQGGNDELMFRVDGGKGVGRTWRWEKESELNTRHVFVFTRDIKFIQKCFIKLE